jgi:hypothetical protein
MVLFLWQSPDTAASAVCGTVTSNAHEVSVAFQVAIHALNASISGLDTSTTNRRSTFLLTSVLVITRVELCVRIET